MPYPPEVQLPLPKSVGSRLDGCGVALSPSAALPRTHQSPRNVRSASGCGSVVSASSVRSPATSGADDVRSLRNEVVELRAAMESDRQRAEQQQQLLSQLGEIATMGGTQLLLQRLAELELDNAKLRASAFVPPCSPTLADAVSPAKARLGRHLGTPPAESPARRLDMALDMGFSDTPEKRGEREREPASRHFSPSVSSQLSPTKRFSSDRSVSLPISPVPNIASRGSYKVRDSPVLCRSLSSADLREPTPSPVPSIVQSMSGSPRMRFAGRDRPPSRPGLLPAPREPTPSPNALLPTSVFRMHPRPAREDVVLPCVQPCAQPLYSDAQRRTSSPISVIRERVMGPGSAGLHPLPAAVMPRERRASFVEKPVDVTLEGPHILEEPTLDESCIVQYERQEERHDTEPEHEPEQDLEMQEAVPKPSCQSPGKQPSEHPLLEASLEESSIDAGQSQDAPSHDNPPPPEAPEAEVEGEKRSVLEGLLAKMFGGMGGAVTQPEVCTQDTHSASPLSPAVAPVAPSPMAEKVPLAEPRTEVQVERAEEARVGTEGVQSAPGVLSVPSVMSVLTEGSEGVVTSPLSAPAYPSLTQPVLIEERWVSRGTYPILNGADVVKPGVPPPQCIVRLSPLLESGNLHKYEADGVTGFYNSSPDKQFCLSFVFSSADVQVVAGIDCARAGNVFKVKIAPGETKPFVQGKIDGYKVTVQYGRPDVQFLRKHHAEQDCRIDALLRGEGVGGQTYIDLEFPPKQSSLCRSWEGTTTPRTWMRLSDRLDHTTHPVGLFVAPVQPNTIRLGSLGDVYCLSAMAVLAERPDLVHNAFVPAHNAGAHTLRLYEGGREVLVTVDTFFPYVAYCPAFVSHLTHPHELWVPLLHKAHAKMRGSYIAARRGRAVEALRAFTGLPLDCVQLSATPPCDYELVFDRLFAAKAKGWVCAIVTQTCALEDANGKKLRARGLLGSCAYCVVRAERVGGRLLVQVRNPWLSPRLWNGRWCHASAAWDEDPATTEAVGMRFEDDGCMWLEWDEVCGWFAQVAFLRTTPHRQATISMDMAACMPSCVISVDVEHAGHIHMTALLSRDKRSSEWSGDHVKVVVLTEHSSMWVCTEGENPYLPQGKHYIVAFMAAGDSAHAYGRLQLTVAAEKSIGLLRFFKPSASLVQSLLRADTDTSSAFLPADGEDPAQHSAPLECETQIRVPHHPAVDAITNCVKL